jgi:hypothetical protein
LVVTGEYLNNAAAYGMSTVTRQPYFLGFIRYGETLNARIIGAGYGTEVVIAERDASSTGGKVFVYDVGQDVLSQLDGLSHTSGKCHSVGSFLDKRIAVVEDGVDLNVYYWETDDTPSTTVNGRMESSVWTFDLPEDEKQLDGFHVLSDANGTKQVTVYYQDNEDGTWTSAGTAATGFHNYLQVSTNSATVKFRSLRVRVDPIAGAKVFAVSARVRPNTYEESWELLLDLSDEQVDEPRSRRRRSDQDRGWQLRDYIRDIADDKTVVAFLDGARYPAGDGDDPDKYSTHSSVVVDIPVDRLQRAGEGQMLVRLRSVGTN